MSDNIFAQYVDFTRTKLGQQVDGSGSLTFDHSVRVFLILQRYFPFYNYSPEFVPSRKKYILVAGLFHDLLEDTDATETEIRELAGGEVLSLVKELTINFDNKTMEEAVKPLYKISADAFFVKMADIIDNADRSVYLIRKNGIKWYETFFVPLLLLYKNMILKRMVGHLEEPHFFLAQKALLSIENLVNFIKVLKEFPF